MCTGGGGLRQRGFASILNKNWIRNVYWATKPIINSLGNIRIGKSKTNYSLGNTSIGTIKQILPKEIHGLASQTLIVPKEIKGLP